MMSVTVRMAGTEDKGDSYSMNKKRKVIFTDEVVINFERECDVEH